MSSQILPSDSGSNNGDGHDPFDPANLRLDVDAAASLGVKKLLTTVPVRKPDKSWFVHCHPDEAYHLTVGVIDLKDDREIYLVEPRIASELQGDANLSYRMLITTINRQGTVFLWPVSLPTAEGRRNEWNDSAITASRLSMAGWVRVSANQSLGAYEVVQSTAILAKPVWPQLPMRELLRIAFKDKFVNSVDHPLLQRLRGEV
jgi:hypothetical protein